MKSRTLILVSTSSGIIGALIGVLLFSPAPANASIATSGYYVCGNKTTGALRMANDAGSNCNKSKEYRYFFLTDATDAGTVATQHKSTIKFATYDQFGCGSLGAGGTGTFDSAIKLPSSSIFSYSLQTCQIEVLVP
jgi:hypothetical protein